MYRKLLNIGRFWIGRKIIDKLETLLQLLSNIEISKILSNEKYKNQIFETKRFYIGLWWLYLRNTEYRVIERGLKHSLEHNLEELWYQFNQEYKVILLSYWSHSKHTLMGIEADGMWRKKKRLLIDCILCSRNCSAHFMPCCKWYHDLIMINEVD